MAQKPVVVPQNKNQTVKKKKHGCCGCLVGILVFVLVINIAGFFVGDYFAKKYLDMSLIDCGKVVMDVLNVNSKKIVTNKYSASDLDNFESELKKQLFLKEETDLQLDNLINSFLPSTAAAKNDNSLTKTIHILNDAGQSAEEPNKLIEYIGGLFKSENMDKARLAGYDETKHGEEYVFNLTDKELAALINDKLAIVLKSQEENLKSTLESLGIDSLTEIIGIEQIIFESVNGVKAGAAAKVPAIKLTLSIKARDLISTTLKEQTGVNLSWLINFIVPTKLYVTAQVGLDVEAEPLDHAVFLNNMDEAAMNRAYKLIANISNTDVQKMINEKIGGFMAGIGEYLSQMDFAKIDEHTLRLDVFESVISLSGLNEGKEEQDMLYSKDVIKTLGGVITSDAENAINKDHAWDNQYFDENTDKVVYDPARLDKENVIDYKKEFMNEIAVKYMLNLNGADNIASTEDDITFDDIMALFGIGETESGKKLELLDLLDPSKLDGILQLENRKVTINDRMMGAILNAQIGTLIGDGSIKDMNPVLQYVIMTEIDGSESVTAGKHNFVEMGLSVNVSGLLGETAGGFGEIISNLIGSKIVLVLKLDVTPIKAGEEFIYEPTTIRYNDLSGESTDTILKTIHKFGIDFDPQSLLAQMETPVRDAINKMGSILPIRLCASDINLDETHKNLPPAIELPSVFEAIDEMLFKKATDEKINADGIESVLKGVNDVNATGFESSYITNPKAENYSGFMEEIQSKFYINPIVENGVERDLKYDDLFGDSAIINFGSFNAANFNFDNDASGLFYDNRAAADLQPIFYDTELAAMIKEKMSGDPALGDMLDIQELSINVGADGAPNGKISIIIKLDMLKLMGEENSDKLDLMPAKILYIKAEINTKLVKNYNKVTGIECSSDCSGIDVDGITHEHTPFYDSKLFVNNMSDETFYVLNAMIAHLNGGSASLDLLAKAREIGEIVYSQFQPILSGLGLNELEFVSVADGDITRNGIKFISFYDFLKKSIPAIGEDTSNEIIKSALQGLNAFDESKPNDNNYKESEIVTSEITNDNEHMFIDTANPLNLAAYATDRYLGYMVNELIKGTLPNFQLKQTIINSGAGGTASIEFTFKMSDFSGSGELAAVIPSEVFVTVITTYDGNNYSAPKFKINMLSEEEQDILFSIIGTTQEEIGKLLDEVLKALDVFENAEYGAKGDGSPSKFNELEYNGYIKYKPNLKP